MAPKFLIIGATGNTGTGVIDTLPELLKSNSQFSGYTLLVPTRSRDSSAAQRLAKIPMVEVVELNWTEITVEWLRNNEVARAFIASHNLPSQFADESTFFINALNAGVKYVIRISTTAANVKPDCKAYYPRQHWAIETLLSTPEFSALKWTSLQPNVFYPYIIGDAARYVKEYRRTGKYEKFTTAMSPDAPVGAIDASEVGVFAAHLLVEQDPTLHNKKKYILNGPDDLTGEKVVGLVESYIGTKVKEVEYQNLAHIDRMAA
jgi:uncharacterized protein YbjT (DUF2867 family)